MGGGVTIISYCYQGVRSGFFCLFVANLQVHPGSRAAPGELTQPSADSSRTQNSCVRSQARQAISSPPPPPSFPGSLPSLKPGNLVILIMKKKHVLFKIPAAEYSAMLFLCDSRIAFAFRKP